MSTRDAATTRPFRRGALAASILALAWALTGCSSSSDEAGGGAADGAYYEERAAAEAGGDMATSADMDAGDSSGESATDDRAIIVTGAMYMTVEDPIDAADRAVGIVEDAGGRVDARSETAATEYEGGWAQLTLRIPAPDLEVVIDDLRGLGEVDEFSTSSSDVTREVTDLDAQISTLRASTARIEGLLTDAEDIKDIITLEDELDRRQAELESLEARQRGLGDRVSMSTIDLSLTTEPIVYVDDSPRTFWDGLVSGWDGLVSFVTGALVVAGVLLPWLAVAALVGIGVVIVVRARRSRRQDAGHSPDGTNPVAESNATAESSPPA